MMAAKTPRKRPVEKWNPVRGCSHHSAGCLNCYAEKIAGWLKRMGNIRYVNGFDVTLHDDALGMPPRWRKPRMVYVSYMGDLFHNKVPSAYIRKVFNVMEAAPKHIFLVLTKRSERAAHLAHRLPWPDNIWMGVTIESNDYVHRADELRTIPAAVRHLSLEPLLGPLPDLELDGIGWVAAGGESGSSNRPVDADWLRDIRDRCVAAKIPFLFRQWGGTRRNKAGRVLDGRTWDQLPQM